MRDVYPVSKFFPSRILDPRSKRVPDPASASENLIILTQKNVSKLSEIRNMIQNIHPGSGYGFFLPIPDPKVKKAPDPGSGTQLGRMKD
jgi:hypothetical protein